jgi:Flp pilus assembly protein TadD
MSSTVADQDGSFRFRNLQAGNYAVVVDAGKEYETGRETVSIEREANGRIVQVAIQLRLKDASNPALAGVPQSALDSYHKGVAAAKKGDSKNAIVLLNSAITLYPKFTLALSELGLQYLKAGQLDKARETFAEEIKLKPDDSSAHLNLGIVLFNQKAVAEAEMHLREALKLNNEGPTSHYYLGLTLINLKRYEEAQKEFEFAIRNGGENLALAHKYLGGLYMGARKNREAADELEKYLSLDPKAADSERIRGTIKELRSKQ